MKCQMDITCSKSQQNMSEGQHDISEGQKVMPLGQLMSW